MLKVRGSVAWGGWAGIAEDLGLTWQTTWGGPCEEEGFSPGWRVGVERANDLWQSLLVTGTVWLVLRLKS